jgi:hypothetical protein
MKGTGVRKTLSGLLIAAGFVLLNSTLLRAQGQAQKASPAEASADDMRSLIDSLHELKAQVESLNAQVKQLRAESEDAREEVRTLRLKMEAAGTRADTSAAKLAPVPISGPADAPVAASPGQPASIDPAPQQTVQDRLDRLEEDLQLANSKIEDVSQTKVESGSKYRLRLSGIVLMNLFGNRGNTDNLDVPEFAVAPPLLASTRSFGGSLRQSQIGLQAFGPNVGSARTSADVRFDFGGDFPETPNGVAFGQMRLRTGTVRLDWASTSLIAGQDTLFFSPLAPSSLASLLVPPLSYSGNLWAWTPQVRVEHRIAFSDQSSLLLQAGVLDSFSGDVPESEYSHDVTWGEQSGQPAYALRAAWSHRAFGQTMTIGFGGYYGRQDWGFGRDIDGWAGTTDLSLPLGKYFALSGEFHRGRGIAGLGGAIGQDVLMNASLILPGTYIRGEDSMGGWAQLKFKPKTKIELNAAFGQENPYASELRRFSTSFSYYGALFSRNQSEFGNFIYQIRSNVLFSLEYRHLRTSIIDKGSVPASQVNGAVGYVF